MGDSPQPRPPAPGADANLMIFLDFIFTSGKSINGARAKPFATAFLYAPGARPLVERAVLTRAKATLANDARSVD